jgi:dTDP-4-amino-4,6-dideoxygalactose transaminase
LVGQKREKVQRALTEKQIEWKTYFRPISALTCYDGWQSSQPNAKHVFDSIIQVPLHCNMETEDCRRIAKIVLGAINGVSSVASPIVVEVEGK